MANGDDKKKNLPAGKHSGYTGYVDNLGGAEYYGEEVDEGGGIYSISGSKGQKTLISREAARLKAIQKGWVDPNITQEEYNKKVDEFYKKRNTTAKEYAAGQTDKQTYKQTSANNVSNTKNNNANNGNTGNGGGGTNIATANANIGDINIGGSGTTSSSTSKDQDDLAGTLTNKGNAGNGPKPMHTSQKPSSGGTRGYSGNSPFNQATANASIGNITINTGGSGSGDGAQTPDPKANITGQNSPLGGGASGLISDIIGGGSGLGVRKTQGGDPTPTQPGGPTARRGSSTPYQMRSLANQFQSWAMNHYNNPNNAT